MSAASVTSVQTAAILSAVLIAGVAAFQVALALGAPFGDAVFGGNAPTEAGLLTGGFRTLAGVQATILLLLGWVLLARTSVVAIPILDSGALVPVTWGIVAFMTLNTVANFAAPHPIERWVMGPITLALVALGLVIALRAPAVA